MADFFGTDLRLRIGGSGSADVLVGVGDGGGEDLQTLMGRDNLAQALTLRLLVELGELTELGHPRYGSRLRELIGEPMDSANLELLRRYVRRSLLADPRVEDVVALSVRPDPDRPGRAEVEATVAPINQAPLRLELAFEFG